jgi:mannosyltransferase OCH1-like enzyme
VTRRIPPILHQVWLGPNPLPDEFAAYRETWRERHPGWTLELWTEDHLPGELRRPEVYDRLRVPAERADILRLEVLWRFGGVYIDTDFECRRSLEPLLDDVEFFTAYLKPGRVNNAIIGATPQHPILDRALHELRPVQTYGYDKEAAGPLFLDRLVKDYPEITIFEPDVFYPSTPGERERAVAIHHAARSWKEEEGFRGAAARAVERTARARLMHERHVADREALARRLTETQRLIERARAGGRVGRPQLRRLGRAPRAASSRLAAGVGYRARKARRRALRATGAGGAAFRQLVDALSAVKVPMRRTPGSSDALPRVVHQVWLSPDPPPRELARAQRSWRRRNAGWTHHIWTDETLPSDLRRRESSQRLRSPAERSQLLRLELLHRFGGVYADPDVECRRPLEPALGGRTFACATFADGSPDDSFLLATPGHPAIKRMLDAYVPTEFWGRQPVTVAELLRTEKDAERLPSDLVAARDADHGSALAVRLHARAREEGDAKSAALAAERELAAAQSHMEAAERAASEVREALAVAERELADLRAARRKRFAAARD